MVMIEENNCKKNESTENGNPSFEQIRRNKRFYVDKTGFIRTWWNKGNSVDLILRPEGFGKSLNLDMVDCFFSKQYEGRQELFEGLEINKDKDLIRLQGSKPVIRISFSHVMEGKLGNITDAMIPQIDSIFLKYLYVLDGDNLDNVSKDIFIETRKALADGCITNLIDSIRTLSHILYKYHKEKVIILIDDYDAPLLKAWIDEDYKEISEFFRLFYGNTLKSNPFLEKALLTGISRLCKESMYTDMNHVVVSGMTEKAFSNYFGFTEKEVFSTMDSYCLTDKEAVNAFYGGYHMGDMENMYHPQAISSYLETGRIENNWMNTSSQKMIEKLLRLSDVPFKMYLEELLLGKDIMVKLYKNTVFSDLDIGNTKRADTSSVCALLYETGYLKAVDFDLASGKFTLRVTNAESEIMLEHMINRWFYDSGERNYKDFVHAMLSGDVKSMKDALKDIYKESFSVFEINGRIYAKSAENFYRGFFLCLITRLRKEYRISSNKESSRGRYDCILEPLDDAKKAVVIEFKVRKNKEANLKEAAEDALEQIKKMRYKEELKKRGFSDEQILCYGIAFDGKETMVLMA